MPIESPAWPCCRRLVTVSRNSVNVVGALRFRIFPLAEPFAYAAKRNRKNSRSVTFPKANIRVVD